MFRSQNVDITSNIKLNLLADKCIQVSMDTFIQVFLKKNSQ